LSLILFFILGLIGLPFVNEHTAFAEAKAYQSGDL
jgi:hypothetical protein